MRVPSASTDRYLYFVALDATDLKTRETGLSSFTVYRSRNGGASAAMTTPTVNETDASNMPGVYELLIDEDTTLDSGKDEQEMVFHVTHAGMAPVTRVVEIYRPKATEGNTLVVDAAGLGDANTVKVGPTGSGTAQTARDIGASVLLSSGTGTGQLKLASGYVAMTWADIAAPTTTVNLSGTTVKAVADAVNANVTQISGDSGAADALEAVLDGTGAKVTIKSTDSSSALLIENSSSGNALYIVGNTGGAVFVGSQSNSPTVAIDNTTGPGLNINSDGNVALDVYAAIDDAARFTTAGTSKSAFFLDNQGTGYGLNIGVAGANGVGVLVNVPGASATGIGLASTVGISTTGGNVLNAITGSLSGAVGSVTGAVGSVTGNVGGNVAGSVGSVTGNVGGNVTGSLGSIAAGGIATSSFAAGTTIPRCTLTDTVTTYTGNTPQTGDAFARVGAPAGASLAADVAAVKTDTGNLVTRITSTLFAGITSLAQWLGLLAGKQVGNSTARTELRATGAGSGTFDETTDALQAIRDRGDAAWTTGEGGGGGSTGDGDTPVDHNTGGADELRYTRSGVGADNVTIKAYLTSDYEAGDMVLRGTTYTNAEGRWVAPLMLDSGLSYTLVGVIPGVTQAMVTEVEVP